MHAAATTTKRKNRPSLPQNKKRGNRNNKQNTRKYRSARYHTIQYMRHLNKHCCLENLGKVDVGRLRVRHLILSSIVNQ